MYIGFTERGDAGLDLSWANKLSSCQGAVLITKQITDGFIEKIKELKSNNFPFIVHSTVTGWGGTKFEPCVPNYKAELEKTKELADIIGIDNIVLRIDPIFPTAAGLRRVYDVLYYAKTIGLLPCRVRISIYDEYRHVKERLLAIGKAPLYCGSFYAPEDMMNYAAEQLANFSKVFNIIFKTCAEPQLSLGKYRLAFEQTGCLSIKDLKLMGLPTNEIEKAGVNRQNRGGCTCLGIKRELLTNRKQCPHKCIYCYWKDSK